MEHIGKRVKMVHTLAPTEIPNGTLGTIMTATLGMFGVQWDNGYYIPMYTNEVEVVNELC